MAKKANITANGNVDFLSNGANKAVFVSGTWDNASAQIKVSADGVNYIDDVGGALVDNNYRNIPGQHVHVRITVINAGANTDLNVFLQ